MQRGVSAPRGLECLPVRRLRVPELSNKNEQALEEFTEFWDYISRALSTTTKTVDSGDNEARRRWASHWAASRQARREPPKSSFNPRIELLTRFYQPDNPDTDRPESQLDYRVRTSVFTDKPLENALATPTATPTHPSEPEPIVHPPLPPINPEAPREDEGVDATLRDEAFVASIGEPLDKIRAASAGTVSRPSNPEPIVHPAPLPPLSPEAPIKDEAIDAVLRDDAFVAKLAREQVQAEDIRRLKPGQWINDEIINFYGALITARASQGCKGGTPEGIKGGRPDVLVFSSFFWEKLDKDGYERGKLARWSKRAGVDIFQRDLIIVPINLRREHWFACAINFRKKRFESYDSLGLGSQKRVLKKLREYVASEHYATKDGSFDFAGWSEYTPSDIPQQANSNDCGVFTCQFMEALSRGVEHFSFTQADVPAIRRLMIWEIANGVLQAA